MSAEMLLRHAGLTQREIAQESGLGTGSAVSRQLRAMAKAAEEDEPLRRQLAQVDRAVQSDT
jgi:hypothetical protein